MFTFNVLRPFFNPITIEFQKNEPRTYESLLKKITEQFTDTLNFKFELEYLEKPEEGRHQNNRWKKITNDREFKENLFMTLYSPLKLLKINGSVRDLIASAHLDTNPPVLKKQPIDREIAFRKMCKNAEKAINENINDQLLKDPETPYPLDRSHLVDMKAGPLPVKINIRSNTVEEIGTRATMEDAHFAVEIEQGFLAAVFDGHCGARMAKAVSSYFPQLFETQMRRSENHVHHAFEATFEILHKTLFDIFDDGSTAVVSYIDPKTNLIYTATLGDSEARIYRSSEDKTSLIPLSCVRDWTSKRDYERAAEAIEDDDEFENFRYKMKGLKKEFIQTNPIMIKEQARFFYDQLGFGPNVSRAFGDRPFFTSNDIEVMSSKPKITVQSLKPGDVVLIACDGLWDYADHSEILKVMQYARTFDDGQGYTAPRDLFRAAQKQFLHRGGGDNVSIVTLRIEAAPE